MRILITGSRTWVDAHAVTTAILEAISERGPHESVTVVHGGARGADLIAGQAARDLSNVLHHHEVVEEVHLPDWSTGRAAGIRRNVAMVEAGADVCLAFIRDGSRGATHCADAAEKAGIPTRRFIA